jgi:predicted PurR-regulated permease PerM
MALNLLYKIDIQLGSFLRGQFFDASLVGFLAIIAMWTLDVKYYILVGIFAGLTNMIPYVGPFAGAIMAVFVVLMSGGSGNLVMMVIVAFLIIQLLDNVLIQPLVVAKSVNLHPLVIIFAVIIGGQFFGILGMLLAVPATGILKVFAIEFYSIYDKYRTA